MLPYPIMQNFTVGSFPLAGSSCNLGLAKAILRILDRRSGLSEKNPIEKAVQVVVAAWSDPAFKSALLA